MGIKNEFYILLFVFAIAVGYGCKQTKYVYIPQVQTRDSIVTKIEYDSIYIKVKEHSRNDTIYRDSIVYKLVLRSDTISKEIIDSIPYPVEVPKYIEKDLNTYQKTFIKLGWAFILAVLAFLGWKAIKLYLRK